MSTPQAAPSSLSFTLEAVGDDRIVVTRRFDAAPGQVWRALTEPALLRQWMGGPEAPLLECEMDLRPGGRHRYVWDGMALGGTIREAVPPQGGQPGRMVHTELFEPDWTDGETVCTTTVAPDELCGGTLLTVDTRYPSREGRDMALDSGMEETLRASYAALDPLSGMV